MDSKETKIYLAIIITAIVLGAIIIYFAISVIRQQSRNIALQKATILAEIAAMENERSRIAADLHDELGPLMSVIKFQVDYARTLQEVEKELLGKTSEQLDDIIERVREIANDLMPSALHRKGLIVAIEEYISKIETTGKLRIPFTHPTHVDLPADTSIHVYRALQEVIHNCIKHASASQVTIHMEKADTVLKIWCRDDGKGFDYATASKGIGLNSLKNRTEILGGKMTLESKPGKGTAFLFEIPVK